MTRRESSPINILAVDDHPGNLISLEAILDSLDVRLTLVTSGEDALKAVLREEFALVLLDVVMPGMNGFEVARHMKQLERTSRIPIIFLTAIATDVQEIYKAYSVGAVDYLVKPLQSQVVKMKVSVFVDLYRQRLEITEQARLLHENDRHQHETRLLQLRVASDTRYRKLVEGIDHAVAWTLVPETGSLSFVSGQAERVFGLSVDALSQPDFWSRRVHPDDRERFSECLRKAVDGNVDQACDHRLIAEDGRHLWFHTGVSVLRTVGEPQLEVHGISLETTDLKRAEETQRLMADMAVVLAEPLEARMAMTRLASLVVPPLADWCVIDAVTKDGLGQLALAHVDPSRNDLAQHFESRRHFDPVAPHGVAHVLRTGKSELYPDVTDTRGIAEALGAEPPETLRALGAVSYMIVPLSARGHVLAVMSLISSVSRRRFTEPDLAVAEEAARRAALQMDNVKLLLEAQDAVRARDGVLGVVSHDLKGPLSVMFLSADVLERLPASGEVIPRARKIASKIRRVAVGMDRLIDDLLDSARIDANRLRVDMQSQDVPRLLMDSLELLEPIAREKSVTLETSVDSTNPVRVLCDQERMRRVFFNIVGNAIKFSPAHSTVAIRAVPRGNFVLFSVSDAGPGIRPEDLGHVFERYWQARESSRLGIGLGLSIAKGIVAAHGGELWAESVVGTGSTFLFTLPSTGSALTSSDSGSSDAA